MNILSIDTSTKNFSLAVSRNGRVARFRNIYLDKVLESSMIPAIDNILRDEGLKFKDLDGFAVGLGPGSFTSLRVGLSTVKAFALATAKPVVGISSLDVIAMNVIDEKVDEICTIMDARRKQIYACIYSHCEELAPTGGDEAISSTEVRDCFALSQVVADRAPRSATWRSRGRRNDGKVLKRKTDYLLTNLDDLLSQVHGKTLFIGDGITMHRNTIQKKYAEARKKGALCQAAFASPKDWFPQAKKLAALAYGRFEKKEYDQSETLVPIYLYAQDCQVQK